jgi:hypothetical protein
VIKQILNAYRNSPVKTKDKHFAGLTKVIEELLEDSNYYLKKGGVTESVNRKKRWDYPIYDKSTNALFAVIEAKSNSGNKNFNNRLEEAVGNAVMNKKVYPSAKRGYLMILDHEEDEYGKKISKRWEGSFEDFLDDYDALCLIREKFQNPEHPKFELKPFFQKMGLL